MVRNYRFFTVCVAIITVMLQAGPALAKPVHHNGKALVEGKLAKDGEPMIDQNGKYKVYAKVTKGKIAGLHVKHDQKGDIPVKKYKTNKTMAQTGGVIKGSFQLAQLQDVGTTYIGYAYIDAFGNEQIYWFPYEMILDGATGAIEYVPLT